VSRGTPSIWPQPYIAAANTPSRNEQSRYVIKLPGSSPSSAKPSTDSSAVGCSNSEGVNICDTIEVNTSDAETTRTDEHITALTAEIARLRAESDSPLLPGPIRQRLADRAAALEKIAERHARTRITPGDDDARR
jgi:hypothetical protein